ncbi:MAG: hypothetical protein IID44_16655 [Planctomycetes bacterium]|nr:hypothetical protein [Planctomycetota bacterium]
MLTASLLLAVVAHADEPKKPGERPAKRPKLRAVPFTISKETTGITKPLRPDGYVDYVKALNQAMSKGVTPKNNAAALIVRAIGPQVDGEPIPERFFKELGIDPLPEKGEYFIDLYKFFPTLDPAPGEIDEDKFYDAHEFPPTLCRFRN